MSVEQFNLWPVLPVAGDYFSAAADDNVYKPTAERIMSPSSELLSLRSMSLEEKFTIGHTNNAMSFSEDSAEVTLNAFRWSAGNSAFSRLNGGIVASTMALSSWLFSWFWHHLVYFFDTTSTKSSLSYTFPRPMGLLVITFLCVSRSSDPLSHLQKHSFFCFIYIFSRGFALRPPHV